MAGVDLELPVLVFRCVWLLIVGLHIVCAVFLTQFARVYHVIAHPYTEPLARPMLGDRYPFLLHAQVVIAFVSALHWWQLFDTLWSSFRARELAFANSSSAAASYALESLKARRSSSLELMRMQYFRTTSCFVRLSRSTAKLMHFWRLLFARHGIFGIESRAFHIVFTIRELAEIVSQTFQARRSSELLPRPWLNNLLVALVVANCWSTPIVQHFFGHRQGVVRVVCLLFDVLLNIGSCMVIPLIVFLPYYRALSPVTLSFPFDLLFDPVWFTNLAVETQLLFSLSTADVLSKLVQHLGIYFSLTTAVLLIRRERRSKAAVAVDAQPPTGELSAFSGARKLTLGSGMPGDADGGVDEATVAIVQARSTRLVQIAVHGFFFVWGLVLLVVHIRAAMELRHGVLGCRLAAGSWFTSGYPCTVYNYNCYQEGTTSPDEASWDHLDSDALMALSVTHCSELKIPRRLQKFRNLLRLQLHNTTLVEWSKESAIAASTHTQLSLVIMSRTNLTGLPGGMLEPLPATIQNIQITHTNLTTLPPDLHTKWHPLAVFYLEHSLLQEFPKTLLSLSISSLSLHGNRIEVLPELVDTHRRYFSFVMNANPLAELPDLLGAGTSFTFFSAERTLLKTLPSWMRSSVSDGVFLFGTPFCESQTTKEAACVARDNRVNGKVPIALLDEKYPL